MNDELKPCPFLELLPFCGSSNEDATKAWNKRAQPTFTPDELDAIRKALEAYAPKSRKQWELGLSIIEKCKAALRRKQ